ncbi:aminotransferase class V-fold PLP-dependent enzyme [Aurantibacter sp.]|uniref:aminotransferase class V-fold PLP-dependent enzyme n=1 Tax=Aurantibacter sp. TaxID=2807103 RepID=UPI0032677F4D
MEHIRNEFPVFQKYIYANTASSGLPYHKLMQWRSEHDQGLLHGGSIMRDSTREILNETRETVARFFNCTSENVALIQNFSIGMNILLEGLDKQEKVLLLDGDYPSVAWPFERRGFSITFAKLNENLEENIRQKVLNEKITVLAISIVQWLDGIKIDLDFLKKLKEEFPGLLIIADGTQFCGTDVFDFKNSGIDVLGASSYKWLLSGYGNGFMLFKSEVEDRIAVKTIGFNSANAEPSKKNTLHFTKCFEPGHLDTLNFGSLKMSLEFFEKIGKDVIEKQLHELSNYAKEELAAIGVLSNVVLKRKNHSTIFNIVGDANLFKKLEDNNIICSQRGNGIRISFHIYNTINDVDSIIKILKTEI